MSANTTGDEYSRGRTEENRQQRQPKVNPRYRPVIIVVWGVGVALLFVLSLFSQAGATIPWVILVSHLFLAGLVRQDIKSIRKQGIEWGLSRHLWFAATLVFPLVAPAYYVYSGRVVGRENERRKRIQDLTDETSDRTSGEARANGDDEETVDGERDERDEGTPGDNLV